MAAYNAGGSLVWSAALNATQFNSGIQSMVAQMAYAQRASQGLSASLSGIATITFAAVVGGIASITAAIYVATKAAADWETQMMSIARVSIDNFDYSTPQGKEQFRQLSRANQEIYMNVPLKNGTESLIKAQEPFALAGFTGKALTDLTEQLLKFSTDINYAVSEENIANAIVKSAQINRGEVEALGGGDYQKGVVEYSKKYLDTVLALSNKYTISPADLIKASTDAAGSATISGNLNNTDRQLAMYTLLNQYGVRPDIMRTMMTSSFSTAGLAGESTARIETALNRIGVATEQTVKGATGKDKTEKIEYSRAQIAGYLLGVSEDRFRSMIETDAYGTQIQLIDAIEKLDVDRLSKNALGAGLFGSYAGRETSKLAGGDALSVYEEMNKLASSAWESGGQVQSQYENSLLELNKQWGLMGQRAYTIKELLGEIVIDPVKSGVKYFSEGLQGAAQWLTKIVDGSRNLDGTVNTWEAIGKVIDGIKSKIPKDAFKIAVSLVGAALVISNLNTIKTAANMAVGALLKMSGITLSPLLGPITTLVGALGTIGIAAAAVAVGLGAIGYSLNPEKFTYFNQLATEAINGVSVVVKQLYTDLSTGDWSAAATHLKDAFMATITWLQGIDWGRLGSEIVTMIGDGANAVIKTVLDIGGWIYDSLNIWVRGNGPYNIGKQIGDFITDGLKTLSSKKMWDDIKGMFGAANNWISLGNDIVTGIGDGLKSGLALPLAQVHDMFITAFAEILSAAVGLGVDIANAITNTINGIPKTLSSIGSSITNMLGGSSSSSNTPYNKYVQDNGSVKYTIYFPDGSYKTTNSRRDAQKIVDSIYGTGTYKVQSLSNTNKGSSRLSDVLSEMSTNKYNTQTEDDKKGVTLPFIGEYTGRGSTELHDFFEWNKQQPTLGELITGKLNEWGDERIAQGNEGGVGTGLKDMAKGINLIPDAVTSGTKSTTDAVNSGNEIASENSKILFDNILKGNIISDEQKRSMQQDAKDKFISDMGGLQAPAIEENIRKQKEAAIESKNITTSGATTSVNILKDGIFESTVGFKDASDYSTKQTRSITDFVNSTSRNTAVETGAITKRAVEESYGPVRIGLTDSGQKIAVIGKVAQQQFENSGNKWVNDTTGAGSTFKGDATSGGQNVKNDLSTGGDILLSKLASVQIGGYGGSSGGSGGLSGYTDAILDKLGGTVASVLGGSLKGLFGNGGTTTTSEAGLLRNVEDITCTGDRVMINTGIYTSPTGEKTAFNPMNNEETRLLSNKVEGTFQDMTCIGTTVNIPGLKYTNPYGVTSYINPTEYNSGGGVLDYQQAATTITQAATDSAKITTSAAKQSSEYQKGADNYHAQSILGIGGLMDQQAKENMRLEKMNRIESGNVWLNGVGMSKDAWGLGVDQTIFDEVEASNEQRKQARDYLGTEATVHSEIYTNLKSAAVEQHAVNTELVGTAASLTALNSSISSSAMNFQSAFQGMISGMYSYSSGGGAWGGTSANGMGGWIGTDSNAYHGSTVTGIGAFISDWVSQNGGSGSLPGYSMSWGAKGSLIEEPTRLIAGEKGRELLLPNNLTELFMKLAALGFNNVNGNGGSGDTVVIVNIDGEQVEKVVSRRQKRNLNLKGLKLH